MIKASITIDSKSAKAIIRIDQHIHKHKKALRLALNDIGSEIVTKISNYIFRPPKTGRVYMFRGQPHQASAPGESPANRTGKLAKSGGYRVRDYYEMTIFETAEYAGFLEYGTSRMAPRPHVIRAVNATKRNAVRAISDHIKRELRR